MFKDWDQVPEWLRPLVEIAVSRELIHGYPDGTIRVDAPVTRGELIAAVAKLAMQAEEMGDHDRVALMQRLANAVVEVRSSAGLGSGVMLSGGRILTNAHVVADDATVMVRWTSPLVSESMPRFYGPQYRVLKRNPNADLALIEVPEVAGAAGCVELAEEWASTDLEGVSREHFAETLYTQGSPIGLAGVLSRGLFGGHRFFGSLYLTFIGAINPGNSGGGVFDTLGRLVGLAVSKPADALVDGIGFAVPALAIRAFLEDMEV